MIQMDNKDRSWEHSQHFTYEEKCPDCWGENMLIKHGIRLINKGIAPLESDYYKWKFK